MGPSSRSRKTLGEPSRRDVSVTTWGCGRCPLRKGPEPGPGPRLQAPSPPPVPFQEVRTEGEDSAQPGPTQTGAFDGGKAASVLGGLAIGPGWVKQPQTLPSLARCLQGGGWGSDPTIQTPRRGHSAPQKQVMMSALRAHGVIINSTPASYGAEQGRLTAGTGFRQSGELEPLLLSREGQSD